MASQSPTGPELTCLGITNSDVRGAFEGLGVGSWLCWAPGYLGWWQRSVCGSLGAI